MELRRATAGKYEAYYGMHYVQVERENSHSWRFKIDSEVSWLAYPSYREAVRKLSLNLDIRHQPPYNCNCLATGAHG
jgi:hypothetical protein